MNSRMDENTSGCQDSNQELTGPCEIHDNDSSRWSWKDPRRWLRLALRLIARVVANSDEIKVSQHRETIIITRITEDFSRNSGRY